MIHSIGLRKDNCLVLSVLCYIRLRSLLLSFQQSSNKTLILDSEKTFYLINRKSTAQIQKTFFSLLNGKKFDY